MNFKNFDLKAISIPKAIGLFILGIAIIVVVISLFSFAFRIAFNTGGYSSPSVVGNKGYGVAMEESAHDGEVSPTTLSSRNIIYPPLPPGGGFSEGDDAEEFEITEYYGHIETGNIERVCGEIETLKQRDYVIFEDANRNERNCNYRFKVENERSDEVLALIEELNPETLNENTQTIKNLVDDFTSETEILQNKLLSVEETLLDATRAYDEVERLATRTQDVESLAKIIDSKIDIIERLTTERIEIKERIERIERQKQEQLDRLLYTFFTLNVVEDKVVDLRSIKESWEWEIKKFVTEFNVVLQKVTVNLASFLLQLIWIALYLVLAILVLKYGLRGAKYIWKK